jgi:hypothetical protein
LPTWAKEEKTNLAYLSHLDIISSIPAQQSFLFEKKNSWLESSAGVGIAQIVRPTRLRGGGGKKKSLRRVSNIGDI